MRVAVFEKVSILVEKLVGLAEDFRLNDDTFGQSEKLFECLKLVLVEADHLPRLVRVHASLVIIMVVLRV